MINWRIALIAVAGFGLLIFLAVVRFMAEWRIAFGAFS